MERRSQKAASLPHFIFRMGQYGLFALGLLTISVFGGTGGYQFFGQISWLDSFPMACMILTGMGPVVEMTSPAAKIFSSFSALYHGVAFLSIAAVFFAPVIHRLLHILHVEEDENEHEDTRKKRH